MDDKQQFRKKLLHRSLIVIVLLVAIGVILLLLHQWEQQHPFDTDPTETTSDFPLNTEDTNDDRQTVNYGGKQYVLRDDLKTVLLIGLDKFGENIDNNSYNNDQQSDFLLLLLIDETAKTCTPLHINRDTMAQIPVLDIFGEQITTMYGQLLLSHTYGSGGQDSCRNTVQAVSEFLYDTPIDHYLSLTMDAVKVLTDRVGGVTVRIIDDFSGIDETLVQGSEVTLSGSQALTYVRSRKGLEDSSNVHRMERQRQYLSAMLEKVRTFGGANASFALETVLSLSEYLVSDCTANQLAELANIVMDYEVCETRTIAGEAKVGTLENGEQYMEFYADEEALQALIVELFYEEKA